MDAAGARAGHPRVRLAPAPEAWLDDLAPDQDAWTGVGRHGAGSNGAGSNGAGSNGGAGRRAPGAGVNEDHAEPGDAATATSPGRDTAPRPLLAAVGWATGVAWRLTWPVRASARLTLRAADAATREVGRRVFAAGAASAAAATGAPSGTGASPGTGTSAGTRTESAGDTARASTARAGNWQPAQTGGLRGLIDSLMQAVLRPVITRVVLTALDELDVTSLVLKNVDLDAIAAQLDVEAVIDRVDLDAVVARVDLDAAVARVDLDAAVARVDLDAAVRRVDLDGAVARVDLQRIINRIDVDGIVADVDLQAVIDRLDIAAIVALVDPDPVVARVNFDAAIARIDLLRIAQEVVDGIDLPGIIRDSTGSLASEAVQGVRLQGQQADDAVGQLVSRMFRRRGIVDGYAPP
jgi:hypothetical protein